MGARRRMTIAALAIGLSALGGASALAGDGPGTSQPRKAKDDPSRRVCRNVIPSGSRLGTRVCRTKAEWDETRDKTQDGVLQFQMKEQTTYEQVPG